ncbi:D-threo-3-hydroxyaspartate dehydratase [Falsiruegeria litorea R37]|uniref:D-threo-3-hydroxyaspartate dehydratase n=1 Tax=Falsiruegeria litorea R37 TaxID=1200284 RepID=A0A1Y5RJD5_9RHOB|nr:alanine racemase [Falsiruegeria litorea]SLN16135.1 D-threo-3-hydroxyaspartate dehydratase [Falsiruegeria litorea R37]
MTNKLADLETPCLLIDKQRLVKNIDRMTAATEKRGISQRPHLKSAKSVDVAKMVVGRNGTGATVSTLVEAESFSEAGITDLLYSNAIVPQKLDRAARLLAEGVDLKVVVDNVEMAERIAAYSKTSGVAFPVLIELDMDGHRSGIRPEDTERLLAVAEILASEDLLCGVMAHAGKSYALTDKTAIENLAREEEAAALQAASSLKNAGYRCDIVSVGSTPTALADIDCLGATEMRAGTCIFFDLVQRGVGVCDFEDIVMSVLTTVTGINRETNRIITDSGWMSLSRDRGTSKQKEDFFYGQVCLEDGTVLPDFLVLDTQQDHGILGFRSGVEKTVPEFEIGTLLRILPNHVCATAAQHSRYFVTNEDNEVEATWSRIIG